MGIFTVLERVNSVSFLLLRCFTTIEIKVFPGVHSVNKVADGLFFIICSLPFGSVKFDGDVAPRILR